MDGLNAAITVSPGQQFTIVLEAQQWQGVLVALSDAPYRVAAPLIQAISAQLQQQAPAQQQTNGVSMSAVPPVN
jgi:hypothetical protein